MANIKSQVKRIRTNNKAHERNKAVRTSLKSAIRKFREAADQLAEIAEDLIAERRRRGVDGDDLLGLLLALRDEDGSAAEDGSWRSAGAGWLYASGTENETRCSGT